jgi:hypothetical protein
LTRNCEIAAERKTEEVFVSLDLLVSLEFVTYLIDTVESGAFLYISTRGRVIFFRMKNSSLLHVFPADFVG